MQKTKKGYAFNPKAIQRRERVIQRLENQLKSGVKPNKAENIPIGDAAIPLTETDRKRIEKELSILKSRI